MGSLLWASAVVYFLPIAAQTWCNKNYLPGQPVVPPGGQFQYDSGLSAEPLLVLRCAPILTPYIQFEDFEAGILVETFVTHSLRYADAQRVDVDAVGLEVSITSAGTVLSSASVAMNSSTELYFPLANLSQAPRMQLFEIACMASTKAPAEAFLEPQTFKATTNLTYLPQPASGSVTKRDGRTGALLVRAAESSGYQPIFPFGFYTSFDGYLDSNLTILDELKADGFTIVHPVPTFGDLEALERVLDRMEALGLYLVYDMRHTYRDPGALEAEVNLIKHRPNLLLWYTADEPDGTSERLDATLQAYEQIQSLDHGYHPISITLNCADYEFTAYSAGADVVMPDTYTIANDPSWSRKYNTSCSPDFGCCGCDNCKGELEDVARRLDDFALRLDVLGWTRHRAVWAVPQAFGDSEFWTRQPTGREFAAQVILSVNHGARGIMPWIDPTTEEIKTVAASLARTLNSPDVKRVLFSPLANFENFVSGRVDVGRWTIADASILMVTNLNEHAAGIQLPSLNWRQLVYDGMRWGEDGKLQFEALGYGVFISSLPSFVVQDPLQ
uniref:Uncharacterized protein n=1 Tax=Mycena chlorophos TaxID=658473 RepID=A0ABQ0L1R8_MYCCL|nr:predicted protein [Mycena chlorophos]